MYMHLYISTYNYIYMYTIYDKCIYINEGEQERWRIWIFVNLFNFIAEFENGEF